MKPKLAFIIDSLESGGAEVFLQELSKELIKDYRIKVFVLTTFGIVGEELSKSNIELEIIGVKSERNFFLGFTKLYQELKSFNPSMVHTWMYYSNFIGGAASLLAGCRNIIWSIHAFNIRRGMLKGLTRIIIYASSFLSYFIPKKIIYCSQASQGIHEEIGFSRSRSIFIPNAINPQKFDKVKTSDFEKFIKCNDYSSKKKIGLIGRYDVQKNQLGFLTSLELVRSSFNNFVALLVGRGCDNNNKDLVNIICKKGLKDNVILLGERKNIPEILHQLDIFVMPSLGEAFPIALCEAMASGLPCIVTNVGDMKEIVGNNNLVIDDWDPKVFSDKLLELCEMSDLELDSIGFNLKQRVKAKFSIKKIAKLYKSCYSDMSP